MSFKLITRTQEETIQFGVTLAKRLKPGDIICLFGDLGSGKTTFVKGLAKGLRINPTKVSSPTFVVMNMYEGKLPLYHFDLYRFEDANEIYAIGYEEFFYGEGIAVVEWAERLGALCPKEYLSVHFSHRKDHGRTIQLKAKGKRYHEIINH